MRVNSRRIAVAIALLSLFSAQAQGLQSPDRPPEMPKLVRKSGGVLQGSAIKRVSPDYPVAAKQNGADGPVVVEVTIDEQGNVISARAISGHPLLTDASVEAARGWKWGATRLSGVPVKVIGTISFNFDMGSEGLSEQQIAAYRNEIRANPKSAEAHYKLAELYLKLMRYAEAKESYEQATRLKPDYAEAHYGLGAAYRRLGKLEEAAKSYKQGITLEPSLFKAYLDLSDIYFNLRNPGQAIEVLELAIKRNARDAEIYHYLGWLYYTTGEYAKAIEPLRKATAIDPRREATRLFLAEAYLKLGNKEAAMAEYTILKELNPAMAASLLAKIKR